MYWFFSTCHYSGDILILRTKYGSLIKTNKMLIYNFGIKDMGEANVNLGMKIYRIPDGIILILSQTDFVDKMIERF